MPVPIMVTAVGEASTGRYFLGQASCEWLPTPLLHSSLSPSVSLSFFFLSCFVFFYWPLLSNSFSFFFFSLFIFNLFCLFSEPFSSFLLTAPSNPHPQSHHLLLNHFSFGHFLEGDLTLTCWNMDLRLSDWLQFSFFPFSSLSSSLGIQLSSLVCCGGGG